MTAKKETATKKNVPFSLLGLLFGDSLDELVSPWISNLATFFIGVRLMIFIIESLGTMIEAFTKLCEQISNSIQYFYGQYQAFKGYKIVPMSEAVPVQSPVNSKTDSVSGAKKPVPKKSQEERIQIISRKE